MIRNLGKNEKGSALIEFGLAAFAILLVLFGLIDLGRAAYAYDWVSDASKRATRFAMVRGTTCDPLLATYCGTSASPRGAQSSDVTTYVDSLAVGINTGQVTVTSQCNGTSSPTLPCPANSWVQVQVAYTFNFASPLFPLNWTMHSTSERLVQQ